MSIDRMREVNVTFAARYVNREDLQLHLMYNHPDVQSAPARR